jgi:hypothetical protein
VPKDGKKIKEKIFRADINRLSAAQAKRALYLMARGLNLARALDAVLS